MFKYSGMHFEVDIWLTNGIYNFPPESSTGKTLLYRILNRVSQEDACVLAITYADYKKRVPILDLLLEREYDVILLDRFDMYQNQDICNVLGVLSYSTAIMVDVKGKMLYCPSIVTNCLISLSRGKVEVFPA